MMKMNQAFASLIFILSLLIFVHYLKFDYLPLLEKAAVHSEGKKIVTNVIKEERALIGI